MSIINKGKNKGYIKFDKEENNVFYNMLGKKYRYTDPEEKVRLETYLQLIFNYGYDPKKILLEVVVPHRTPNNLADIIVYSDDELKEPYIVVECKKQDISDAEFMQAIEQGFGNTNSVGAKFLWITSGLKSNYYDVKNFKPMEREKNKIADLPKFGEKKSPKAKYTKGGVNGMELEVLNQGDLTKIFKQAHDALWAGGKRNPAEAFDELDKIIFCKVWDERAYRGNGEPYDFQIFTGEDSIELHKRIKKIYDVGKKKDPQVFRDDIRLDAKELEKIVGYLAKVNLSKTDLDSKGRAFETFMGSFFRGEFGQYFTPRPVVEFIINSLPITNESMVLDTSCGSGGFLLYALDKVRNLAMEKAKIGWFSTDPTDKEHYNFWHDFANDKLFGIEISENIARTAKMNMIIHDDGHTNVISYDGLESIDIIRAKTDNPGFKENNFNYILTNPPFGANIKYSEKRYVENYELGINGIDWISAKLNNTNLKDKRIRDRQSSEILFIEQCYRFLKPKGILAMVIPDGILSNSSLKYVREWIEEHYRIIAIISLPQTTFMATGAGVKSSVIFLQKYAIEESEAIVRIKNNLQDLLFELNDCERIIADLENEKKSKISRGNIFIQEIQNDTESHIENLINQGNLDKDAQKDIVKQVKEKIKEYQKTDEYREWKKQVSDYYNEQIQRVKDNLQEEYMEKIAQKLNNYPIFMSIAEDIGYDATGKETGKNELIDISKELHKFIQAVLKDEEDFFL